jgi:hypothetical protein
MSEAAESSTEPYLLVEKCGSARGVPIYVITKHIPSVHGYLGRPVILRILHSATGGYPSRTVRAALSGTMETLIAFTEGNQMHGPRSRGYGNVQGSARRLHIHPGSGPSSHGPDSTN